MKRQVRRGVFETNSSSTHSLTMCSKQQFEDWQNGKILFDYWKEKFVEAKELTDEDKQDARDKYESKKSKYWKNWDQLTEEEVEEWYNSYAKEHKIISNDDCKTYEDWRHDDYLDYFVDYYTTPGGEEVVAFGKYGYDG